MKREIDVMATGHICFDIIPQFPPGKKILLYDLLAPGKLINIGTMTIKTPRWKYDARQKLWHGAKDKEQVKNEEVTYVA